MMERSIYRCSDGQYYGDVDLWERFESGEWTPHCWDSESGSEWVETRDEELLILEPISRTSLPDHVQTESVATGTKVQ